MNSREGILDAAAACLSETSDYLTSLAGLRDRLEASGRQDLPSPRELENWLREDPRFDLLEGGTLDPDLPPEVLARAGIIPGARVGLRARRPGPNEMIGLMEAQAGRMLSALQKAYDSRPSEQKDGEGIEDRLLELLGRAKEIRDRIRQARRELAENETETKQGQEER